MFIDDKNEKIIPKRRMFMADKNIKEFVTGLKGRFNQANTILSGLNGVEGKTYTYMKKSINDLLRISLDEKLTYEALRKKFLLFEEQMTQFMREQRFEYDESIEGANDFDKNNAFIDSLTISGEKQGVLRAINQVLKESKSWIDELDENYPDIKKREDEKKQAELDDYQRKEEKATRRYIDTIHKYDEVFAKAFQPDKNIDEELYKNACTAYQNLMNRMHRESPTPDEYLFVKDSLKKTKSAMTKYVMNIREKYGVRVADGKNNATDIEQNAEAAVKIKDPEEKKRFMDAVNMMEMIKDCEREIDNGYGVRTVTRSIEDFCVTSSESFGKLINSKKFWGKRGNNSIEFNTYSDNCRILLEKMKNAEETKNPVSIAECRELLKNIEESAMTYVRAKRVQKGYDTREIPDFDVDKRMLGNSDKGGPMLMTTKGRERYDFAITTLLATGQMKLSLDSLEKKLEDDAKEIKRVEKYEKNRKTFLEHKEKLNKQFEAFAKSRNKLKGNVEAFDNQIEKVTKLSDAMAEKFEKGMDIWSKELEEYNNAIKDLKEIAKNNHKSMNASQAVNNDTKDKEEVKNENERESDRLARLQLEAFRQYKVEFVGKKIDDSMKACNDPEKLREYLKDNSDLEEEVKEHVEKRIGVIEKIKTYEKNRSLAQKDRQPCVKLNDGTIMLSKKKDVPKQTTQQGCWSAVLSDMLNHFGVDLSQQEVRGYRPDIHPDKVNTESAKNLVDRLNSDKRNEIYDMVDLIQRTVPNVAYHHMALDAFGQESKSVFKQKVEDSLLNQNSPVALLYKNHYVSIVGIRDNTIIVQDPNPKTKEKYQEISIDAVFNESAQYGQYQIMIDWLEDLTFEKDGTCKNVTEQWKKMGIECKNGEFKASEGESYLSHVKGYAYTDTDRFDKGIEESIYMPKMSFEKEMEISKEASLDEIEEYTM